MQKARLLIFVAAAYLPLHLTGVLADESGVATHPDVRVVIDVSGSMKQNDPNDLRIPALNLLIGLLPEDAVAGVWTFAEQVNMLVPHAKVDGQWKNMAKLQSAKINSVGLFTNIGSALEEAAFDAGQKTEGYHRSIILLTDGMVDIDRDPNVNLTERTRLLEELLPEIMTADIPVHSIALSKKADSEAMQRLSLSTGGIFAVAESADDLTNIFLQAFDRSAPSEQVPLLDNQFLIDSSIEEFTVLAFRKVDSEATTLKSPAGASFRVTDYPDHVRWYADRGFDLITVRQPLEGEWVLYADKVPENRVTIISDLKLMVNDLPVNTYPGDELGLTVHFEEEGSVIVDPDILKLLDVQAVVTFPDGSKKAKTISAAGAPAAGVPAGDAPDDGVFRTPLTIFRDRGKYNILVSVDGKTFVRERFQDVFLRNPVTAEVHAEAGVIRIKPISKLIDLGGTEVVAKVKKPDDKNVISPLALEEAGYWDLDLSPFTDPGSYQLRLDIEGRTLSGQLFNLTLDTLSFQYPPAQAAGTESPEESVLPEPALAGETDSVSQLQATPAVEIDARPTAQEQHVAEAEDDRDGKSDPGRVDGLVFGALLLFASVVLSGCGYWWYRRRTRARQKRDSEPVVTEQAGAELDVDLVTEPHSPDDLPSGEDETVLRETTAPDEDDAAMEDADPSVSEDVDGQQSMDALGDENPEDEPAEDEQDLDDFLDGISSDLAEKAEPEEVPASASNESSDEGDQALSDGDEEPMNGEGGFPGDRSLVLDEDAVDELVEQNRPADDQPQPNPPA